MSGLDDKELMAALGVAIHSYSSLASVVWFTASGFDDGPSESWRVKPDATAEEAEAILVTSLLESGLGYYRQFPFLDELREVRERRDELIRGEYSFESGGEDQFPVLTIESLNEFTAECERLTKLVLKLGAALIEVRTAPSSAPGEGAGG
ncbi:MAG: hypothetical protein AMXMBFR80_13110 [Dehalococcoidia bacterium]